MAEEEPDAPPGWTLGDIRKWGMKLEAICKKQGCGEFVVFNLDGLIERFGADYPLPDSGPGVTCEQCGSAMKFQLAVWHSDHEETEG
jgi:hypothetical protein